MVTKLTRIIQLAGYASLSGLSDLDYPTIDHTGNSHLDKHLTSFKRVPLPDELLELFSRIFSNIVKLKLTP